VVKLHIYIYAANKFINSTPKYLYSQLKLAGEKFKLGRALLSLPPLKSAYDNMAK